MRQWQDIHISNKLPPIPPQGNISHPVKLKIPLFLKRFHKLGNILLTLQKGTKLF